MENLVPSDLDAMEAIEQLSYPDPWSREMLSSAWTQSNGYGIKYVSNGQLVGYMITSMFPPALEILNIAVHSRFRKRGIAREMMAHILDEARRRGCTESFLEVRISNIAAITLYESFGFTPINTRKKYYRDGEDGLVMRAKI